MCKNGGPNHKKREGEIALSKSLKKHFALPRLNTIFYKILDFSMMIIVFCLQIAEDQKGEYQCKSKKAIQVGVVIKMTDPFGSRGHNNFRPT